jgi:hypothetical protein
MGPDRRKPIALAALVVVLASVVYYVAWRTTSGVPPPSSNGRTGAASNEAQRRTQLPIAAPDVHLEELEAERPKPAESNRNLFRFKPKPPPPSEGSRPGAPPPTPVVPSGQPQSPPLPPITLKFLGQIGPTAQLPKMAVLSDGKGTPVYGKEGDIILGQFRIVHIGAESIEMSYLDGRGRTTIRQTGS